MRILALNLKAGGTRTKIDALLQRVFSHGPNVVVFSEYRDTLSGENIRAVMRRSGYEHQAHSEGHRGNGVLVAARTRFVPVFNPAGLPEDAYPNAIIECVFAGL